MFPWRKFSPFWKWGTAAAGAVCFGIVGNALWDGIKSFSRPLGHVFIAVVTLGVKSWQDSIYKEISRGGREEALLAVLFISIMLFMSLVGEVWFNRFREMKRMERRWQELGILSPRLPEQRKPAQDQDFSRDVKTMRRLLTCGIVAHSFVISWFLIKFITLSFEIHKIDVVEQELSAIGPYLTSQQALEFRSRFALIKSEEDYDSLVSDMGRIVMPAPAK